MTHMTPQLMTPDLWCLILLHIKRSIRSIGYVNLKIIYLRLLIINSYGKKNTFLHLLFLH